MSATSWLAVRLRTADLVAQSTGELLHRVHPSPAELAALERRVVWVCEWTQTAPADAVAALVRPGVLHNPNKEAFAVFAAGGDVVCPTGLNDAVVVTWPHDGEADATVRGILRRAGCDPGSLSRAWCCTVWALRAAPGAPPQIGFAREVAEVRGRGHGVLANPHLAAAAVFDRSLTAGDLLATVSSSSDQGVHA